MKESGYYPAGAEFDPRAPWNETAVAEPEAVEREVEYTCTLRRSATVSTSDYDWGWRCVDFSGTDWTGEWKRQRLTPHRLMGILESVAMELARGRVPERSCNEWKEIAESCQGWQVDDEEAEEAY